MDAYLKYQIHVTAEWGKNQVEAFVDLFSKYELEKVRSIVQSQLSRMLRFPFKFDVELLPADAFLYQAQSNVYSVASAVCVDLMNIFYNYGKH